MAKSPETCKQINQNETKASLKKHQRNKQVIFVHCAEA